MKHPVYIFGETDHNEERHEIELEIIRLFNEGKITYLLTEEIGSQTALSQEAAKQCLDEKRFTTSDLSYKLAINIGIPLIGIDNRDKKTFAKDSKDEQGNYIDRSRSFSIRESRMVDVIHRYGLSGGCAVIVNNRHLRTEYDKVCGEPSPIVKRFLCNPNVFFKSHTLNNSIVTVNGTTFNKNIYCRLLKLSNTLTSELTDIGKLNNPYYDMGDFLGDDVYTYCYLLDNTIVSILTFKFNNETDINIELFYTEEKYRSKGYGTALFNQLFECYPKEQYTFYVGPIINNSTAIRLYKKMGFNEVYTTLKL